MCQYVRVYFSRCSHYLLFKANTCPEFDLAHAFDLADPTLPLLRSDEHIHNSVSPPQISSEPETHSPTSSSCGVLMTELLSGYSILADHSLSHHHHPAPDTTTNTTTTTDTSDYTTLKRLLRHPQHPQPCPTRDPTSGLPLCEISQNWSTDRECGVHFRFQCTHNVFKKFKRFQPGLLERGTSGAGGESIPEWVAVGEVCRRCGGSGVWRDLDVGGSDL